MNEHVARKSTARELEVRALAEAHEENFASFFLKKKFREILRGQKVGEHVEVGTERYSC